MKYRAKLILVILAFADTAGADDADRIVEIAENCIAAEEPGTCMENYGFRCRGNRVPDWSPEPRRFGCNIPLGDGRYHFVQIASDANGWKIESEHAYTPELDDAGDPAVDTQQALSNFVLEEMRGYNSHSSGSYGWERSVGKFEVGTRKEDEHIVIRAVCGIAADTHPDDSTMSEFSSDCEQSLLRTIRRLSQSAAAGPYRAAGPSEIQWQRKTVTLASADVGLILDGRYVFEPEQRPCMWISDCCSTDGSIYLDSCRTPTDSEEQVIASCLSEGLRPRTDEFFGCLSKREVKIGCEAQPDGSRICY